jgi:hypothetical protein
MSNVSATFVEKIKHILYSITFFRNRAVYEIMLKKYGTARQATDDSIIRRMRFACWITKATDTLRICNTYCFSTVTMVKRTRLNVTCICRLPLLFALDLPVAGCHIGSWIKQRPPRLRTSAQLRVTEHIFKCTHSTITVNKYATT